MAVSGIPKTFVSLLVSALASMPVVAWAQATADPVRVAAVDASGHPIVELVVSAPPTTSGEGLPSSAFEVFEGGEPRRSMITPLDGSELGLVIVADTSEMTSSSDAARSIRAAAVEIVLGTPRGTRIAVIGAGAGDGSDTALTEDTTEILERIRSLPSEGQPAVYDAVSAAVDLLTADGPRRRVVAVLTDSGDVASTTSVNELKDQLAAGSTAVYLAGDGAPAVAAALGTFGGSQAGVVGETGLIEGVDDILLELANQYRVSFESGAGGRTEVTLRVTVAGRPTLETTTAVVLPSAGNGFDAALSPDAEDDGADGGGSIIPLATGALLAAAGLALMGVAVTRVRHRGAGDRDQDQEARPPLPSPLERSAPPGPTSGLAGPSRWRARQGQAAGRSAAGPTESPGARRVAVAPTRASSWYEPRRAPATREEVPRQADPGGMYGMPATSPSNDASPRDLEEALAATPLPLHSIPGLEPALLDRLRWFGVTRAVHVDPRLGPLIPGRPKGRVPGLSPRAATALASWRRAVEAELRSTEARRFSPSTPP